MAHYFDKNPEIESKPKEIQYDIHGRTFRLKTDQGVFSKSRLDDGSRLLIETVINWMKEHEAKEEKAYPSCLDLGCGYGVVGITLKRIFKQQQWTFVDINQRAIDLTKDNLKSESIMYTTVKQSDAFENIQDMMFDFIFTNPPIRTGKKKVKEILLESRNHLTDAGYLFVVIGKKQGALSYEKYLSEIFGNCIRLAKDHGFYIFACQKKMTKDDDK